MKNYSGEGFMKRNIKNFLVKAFSMCLAFILIFPTNLFAMGLDNTKSRKYNASASIMGLAQTDNTSQNDKEVTDQTLLETEITKKETDKYLIEKYARLSKTTGQIEYMIKVHPKDEESKDKITTSFAISKNTDLKDLKIEKISQIHSDNSHAEIKYQEQRPSILYNNDAFETLGVTTDKADLVYYLSAQLSEEALGKIDEKTPSMDLDINVAEAGANLYQDRYALSIDKMEVVGEDGEDTIETLKEKENPTHQVKAIYKEGSSNLLGENPGEITWTDFIHADDDKEFTTDIKLDEAQDATDAQIKVEFYQANEKGYTLKEDFTKEIPFTESLKLQIPLGFIAKVELITKVTENKKEYSLNQTKIPNPIYKEEKTEEESEEEDADPLPEETSKTEESKGTSEEKIIPIDPETNEAVIDHSLVSEDDTEETKSAINLNRDSVINNFKNNEKLNPVVEITINNISSLFNAYNNDEMTYEEFLANLKTQAKDLSKEDFAEIVQGLIAGLNQETYKVANMDEDQLLAEVYGKEEAQEAKPATEEAPVTETKEADTEESSNAENDNVETETTEDFRTPEDKIKDNALESFDKSLNQAKEASKKPQEDDRSLIGNISEGIKGIFGQSNLQKADKELKAAIADGKSLEEIQALLLDLGKRYDLNTKDEAKLMADNETAIKEIIARDADQSFKPSMLMAKANANANPLDTKKFTIRTRFDTSTAVGDIQAGQFFKIHLDEKLTVKEGTKLEPITYNGEVIANPKYNDGDNTITYTITKNIGKNIQVPLEIPVDYNTEKIPAGEDFTVINKVSGLGVTDPKALPPEKIDKNGNPAGTIIEEGGNDVVEIIDTADKNYKFNLDANASPVVENAELVGYNWTIRVTSDTDLRSLGYKANFTTVDGSGLGEITSKNISLEDNPIKGNFGIVDSKHHNLTSSAYEVIYNLFTPAKDIQASYMLDISVVLANEGKVGAERVIAEEGYSDDMIEKTSPTRVSMNNRTSIKGEFASNTSAKWTITDAVSTNDANNGLPLATRELGNQTFATGKTATYGLDDSGKMVAKANESTLSKLPVAEENPADSQAVGNIAVYEVDTNLNNPEKVEEYSVSGVRISKYRNIPLEQTWGFPENYENMPAQDITVTDKAGNELGETSVEASDGHARTINIPDVKYWDIANDGTATMIDHKVVQTFPDGNVETGGKTYKYDELANYYDQNLRAHYLYNKLNEVTNKTPATFTVIKIDSKDGSKRLAGAKYYLNGAEVEITTDANGEATFKNIQPGSYTLVETKAPDGYKLDQDRKYITVSDDGKVSVVGNNAQYSSGSGTTELVEHSSYPSYPDFMNAQHYGKINDNGDVEFYLYLKPYDQRDGGRTDKDTTLNISLPGVNLTNSNVTVYDVDPNQRQSVFDAMNNQNVSSVLGNLDIVALGAANNNGAIEGSANTPNPLSGTIGYQLSFPTGRFGDNWGFLVKVTGNIGNKDNTILSYDWLAKNNPGGEARIRQKVNLSKNTIESKPTITITNEEYKKSDIEIAKFDTEKNRLAGAEFELKDSDGRVLRDVTADEKGNANFGKYPPGTYYLEESKAPVGYEKSNVYFVVTVDEQGQVSYKAKFKNSDSIPTVGNDYYIERTEGGVDQNPIKVSNIDQNMWINDAEGRGYYQNVWEAYRLESLMWKLDADLSNVSPGKTLEIQFDQNLDFTQYFNNFPNMESKGKVIAEPHFDYKTNLLTYVFNDNSKSDADTHVHIELKGMIPSKFYQLDTSTKEFTNVVAPGKTVTGKQSQTISVRAYYEGHDNHVSWPYDPTKKNAEYPTQSYYFRDVYKGDDGKWYVKAIAYYNPLGNYNYKLNKQNNIYFNWIFTDWSEAPQPEWVGKYNIPYKLRDVKIYRTDFPGTEKVYAKEGNRDVYSYINRNMPLSYGVVPENDPNTYELVYSSPIDPESAKTNTQGNITLKYDPKNLNPTGSIINVNNPPLELTMPTISANEEGYVIEQTFSITDIDEFYRHWRAFSMVNGPRNKVSLKSTFIVGPNQNHAKADQVGVDLPETFKEVVGIINKRYQPARFTITKVNGDTQAKLEGASFILTDADSNSIIRTSDKNGLVEFKDLAPGTYTLKEYKAPKNFKASKEEWQVTVYSNGYVKIETTSVTGGGSSHTGDNINITVENKPTGEDFRIYKKDDEGKGLAGAEFTLTKQGETNPTKTEISNANGIVKFEDLTDGVYVIEETKAPDGYNKLNKKWVLEVKNGKKKVYTYSLSGTNIKSILGEKGTYWVNVKERPTSGWNRYDNRLTGWAGLSSEARYLGTRIVAINKEKKYVIQRYVINPEARDIEATTAIIHRELPEYPNMDWYKGDEEIKAFTLDPKEDGNKDGKVHGLIPDLRLADYETTEIPLKKEVNEQRYGQRRLKLSLPATKKPIVIDVKVPYKDINGGVGTGMDWYEGGQTYWKSDYYESVSDIRADDPTTREAGSIIGSYIAEGSLDVTNQAKTYGFKIKKVKEGAKDTLVPGAKFKLTGGNLSKDGIDVTSNKDGIVEFTGLKPGQYTLEETEPAPGYEKTDKKWQVTITNEGKAWIKENASQANSTNRVMAYSADSQELEIGDQLVDTDNSQAAGISKIDYEILNLKNADRFKNQIEVTTNAEYLGNSQFKVRYDMKNITGSTLTNKQFSVHFNNDATFELGSTHTWKWSVDGQQGDPNNPGNKSKWHSGYDSNTKIIGINNNELTINAGDTASIEFIVNVNSALGAANLVDYIRYDNSNITPYPRARKRTVYKISYNANGGTITTDPMDWSENGKLVEIKEVSPKAGYTKTAGPTVTNNDTGKTITIRNDNKFSMPVSDVTVSATFEANTYNINKGTITNGSVVIASSAKTDEEVSFKVKPNDGYKIGEVKLTDDAGNEVKATIDKSGNGKFTMPASNVSVNATFIKKAYKITKQNPINGDFTVPETAEAGNRVTITLKPADGYDPDTISVRGGQGPIQVNGNTFTMPESDVVVEVTFKKIPPKVFNITVNQSKNGSVNADKQSAKENEKVTLTVSPDKGYLLDQLLVDGKPVEVTDGTYTFTMPKANVTVSATFRGKPIGPPEGSIEIPKEGYKITNKQTGLNLKIFKKDNGGYSLQDAEFTLVKYIDKTYGTVDDTFEKVTVKSDENGNVNLVDKDNNPISLEQGYYRLTETKSPLGYKQAQAPWDIEVYEDGGQLKAKYKSALYSDAEYIKQKESYASDQKDQLKTAPNGIKYKSKITSINTETKTYVQRIYIDTRAYRNSDKVNVQITPKYKREEIDIPGVSPATYKEGVKTAYRSTYKITGGPTSTDENAFANNVLENYDLSKNNVTMLNTARWRPFDWGFDEDIMNLDAGGIYYIDVEGFYDEAILDGTAENEAKIDGQYNLLGADGSPINPYSESPALEPSHKRDDIKPEDYKKLNLYIDFYDGARSFQQVKDPNATGDARYTDGSDLSDSYLDGNVVLGYVKEIDGESKPTAAGNIKDPGKKYPNWLSKKGGRIYPAIGNDVARTRVETSVDLSSLYISDQFTKVPNEGMTVLNDKETYNITFTKHGRDNEKQDINGEEVTKNRLEGAIFRLEKDLGSGTFVPVEGSYVGSAFNGFFGFRGLEPGRYRLIEVKAPEGYNPIKDPLLYFTIKTVNANSGEVVNPENGRTIDIKDAKIRFTPKTGTVYRLGDLEMVNPKDPNTTIAISQVDSKEIDIETAKILNKDNGNQPVALKDLIVVSEEKYDKDGNPYRNEYPVSQIKIIPKSSGYISLEYDKANGVYQYVPENTSSEKDGKLIDFVTGATAKNMGKIINEKPGEGKVTIKKVDSNNNLIKASDLTPGAEFRLTRVTAKADGTMTDDSIRTGKIGEDGTLTFENLPIGTYRLTEIKSPDGYMNTDQIWYFTVGGEGLDPYAGPIARTGRDLSDKITLETQKMTVINPDKKTNLVKDEIHPHFGESMEFTNKFAIDPNTKINPGDYFVLHMTDQIDINGIFEREITNLDIIADGVGTIAKADYDRTNRTITYTFTDYANTYELIDFSNKLTAFIDLYEVKNSDTGFNSQRVGFRVGNDTSNYKNIKVIYDLDYGWKFDALGNGINLVSKIVKYNPTTGEFLHYFYINRLKYNSDVPIEWRYRSDQDIENLNISYAYLVNNYNIENDMPESFGVDESSNNLYQFTTIRAYDYLANNYYSSFRFTNGLGQNESVIIKVTGKVAGVDKSEYVAYGDMYEYTPGYTASHAQRHDAIRYFQNEATARVELGIKAVNHENMIRFKKVDQDDKALAGASFQLQIETMKDGSKAWENVGDEITTRDDGIVEYKKLKPGKYQLIETKAPDGYKIAEGPVETFEVNDNGKIIRKETLPDPVGSGQTEQAIEETGTIPIPIVNRKEENIDFTKVDAENKTKTLEGAEFEVWYKASEADEDYTKLKVYEKTADGKTDRIVLKAGDDVPEGYTEAKDDKIISGTDGKLGFKFYDPGYYALKETKAPKGYGTPRGYVYEYRLVDGKVEEKKTDTEGNVTYEAKANNDSIEIENQKSTFPLTGGNGVFIGFAIIGTAVMLTALAYFGIYQNDKNRRRSARYKK